MQFFNIRTQVVSLVMPDGKTAVTLDFKQNPADAMVQELRITPPEGGPNALITFDKAGLMREARWEGVDGAPAGDPDAAQLDQQQASEMGLKPGQKSVDGSGRLVQAPGKASDGRKGPAAGQDGGAQARPVESANANPPYSQPVTPTPDVASAGEAPAGVVNTTESMKARPPRTP